jgi:hypothetical protein
VNASGIEPKAKIIVYELKFNKTSNAKKHNISEYMIAKFTVTLPEAIGRSFVRNTFASNFLSRISFTMHPADLIKTEPKKNKIR